MSNEMIVLVDQKDNTIGELSKIEVHKKGLLHRAVSVFIFDSSNKTSLAKDVKQNIIQLIYGQTRLVLTQD